MSLLDSVISTIAPHPCLLCGLEGELICADCLPAAVITKRPTCYRCNRLSEGGKTCINCRRQSALSGVSVASHYDGAIKTLVHRLKFDYARSGSTTAAKLLAPLLSPASFDLISAVPSAPARLRERGFNQAQLIGKELSKLIGLPYADLLIRTKNVHQVGLTRRDRLAQVEGIFLHRHENLIQEARILLVDDVITTGATMAECAKTLKNAGAKQIWGVAVAKH